MIARLIKYHFFLMAMIVCAGFWVVDIKEGYEEKFFAVWFLSLAVAGIIDAIQSKSDNSDQ